MTSQGKKIYGVFVRSNGTHGNITVLYCHGNRDHLQYYWNRVELIYRMGFNVFIFDYQGYGMSEGTTSESGLYSDGRAALAYIRSRPNVIAPNIVFYGFSLGNVVSIDLAANVFTPKAIVAEAPFASSSTLVQSGTLLDIPSSYVMKGEYNNAEKIKSVHAPLLIIHGESDKFIDLEKNSTVIFKNANQPKQFVRVPGADHSEIPAKLGEANYINLVQQFILQTP
jgi:fermentation-respiration switch protein FrsA (DUF1100 family)